MKQNKMGTAAYEPVHAAFVRTVEVQKKLVHEFAGDE